MEKYAHPMVKTLEEAVQHLEVDLFRDAALTAMNNFLGGTFIGKDPQRSSIFDTWGEILKMAIRCLTPLPEEGAPVFDSSTFESQLFDEMNQTFLRRLFRHLDVIALETYATNYDDPNIGFELFKKIVSESNLITLNNP